MIKQYVRFWHPGILFSEESVREIKSREDKIEIPRHAYGYQFFDHEVVVQNGEELLGKEKNTSGTFYIGVELTAEQAKAESNSIARSNIEINGYTRLVRTAGGQMFPMREGDKVVVV